MKTNACVLILISFLISSCIGPKSYLPDLGIENLGFQKVLDSIYAKNPEAVGILAHVELPTRKVSWSGAAGFSDKENKTPLVPNDPALIASNVKTYMSAAILRLVEMGKIQLDEPIEKLISDKTAKLFSKEGYDLKTITVAHLLSHTSGIFDYVNADLFFAKLKSNPNYHWTRESQLKLATTGGDPLGAAGSIFSYADTNYLLLGEILERFTEKSFFSAARELLRYEKHNLNHTWWADLEERPDFARKRVHQYSGAYNLNSYKMDLSFDLYGAGGMVATSKDLARFCQLLFEGKLFDDPKTAKLLYHKMPTKDGKESKYFMGISQGEVNGMKAFGHGGFWGSVVHYIPELNASISVFILERDKNRLRKDVLDGLGDLLVSEEE